MRFRLLCKRFRFIVGTETVNPLPLVLWTNLKSERTVLITVEGEDVIILTFTNFMEKE